MVEFSVRVRVLKTKSDAGRSLKLANFCGRGLVARENQPMKSLNCDTRPILSFATSYHTTNTQQLNANSKMTLASFLLHPMDEI